MRLKRRIAELEVRIEALEAGTRWTEVPAAPTVDMDPASGIWLDLAPDTPLFPLYDDTEDWPTGVYL